MMNKNEFQELLNNLHPYDICEVTATYLINLDTEETKTVTYPCIIMDTNKNTFTIFTTTGNVEDITRYVVDTVKPTTLPPVYEQYMRQYVQVTYDKSLSKEQRRNLQTEIRYDLALLYVNRLPREQFGQVFFQNLTEAMQKAIQQFGYHITVQGMEDEFRITLRSRTIVSEQPTKDPIFQAFVYEDANGHLQFSDEFHTNRTISQTICNTYRHDLPCDKWTSFYAKLENGTLVYEQTYVIDGIAKFTEEYASSLARLFCRED